jgi:threonine dehydrogenase-like Zn-dependent dehydrogenase
MLNPCENEELMRLAADGAFAEYIAVKVKFCWSLSKLERKFERDDTLKIGTLIELLGCAYNGVFFSSG